CELAAGRVDEALAAWDRVPPGSPFFERAALARARVAVSRGRFADVESSLQAALRHPGPMAAEVRSHLARNLRFQVRLDEVIRLIESGAEGVAVSAAALRERAAVDLEAFPAEGVAAIVAQAARDAPDDDRVWLAQANLATLAGRFDDADARLSACQRR